MTAGAGETVEKIKRFLLRYKAAAILLALGLALVLLSQSGKSAKREQSESEPQAPEFSLEAEEKRIAAALVKIDGAGEVKVVLTL